MAWFRNIGPMFRKFTVPITTAGIAAVVSLYFYPQTLGLPHYQRVMAHYQDGAMKPVDSEIQQLIEKVLHRINLPVEDEERISFFTSFPKDPLHKGSIQLRTGALIGLPSTFSYQTADDVECSSILVNQEMVDWNSSSGEDLRNSLVLSDKAKAFVIGREIYHVKSFIVHIEMMLQCCSLLLAYGTGATLNHNLLLTLRLKPWARFVLYSTIAVAWLFAYIVVDDAIHCFYDNNVDKSTANLRKIYAEGGVEYYNAVLRRNAALRTLLGSTGTKEFTYYGNVVSVWRNRGVQLTSRRDNLLKYLAEYEHQDTVVSHDADQTEPNTKAQQAL